ncbi:alpha/beta hydrolase family protein [Gordonia sp. ABSL1-1]|uniref:alpha/beta hydrolase n=1 Tax=Gordonia sp. ABSL1-1 TaxID=3053923 RepID=UPI0025724B81|nr:alpha/beta hydrolase family protein [Gordonia sp. ABSL1-1]MDL9936666.1 alpha/beta hydrolase family protein [Gordonia sp. ABSL1-1]
MISRRFGQRRPTGSALSAIATIVATLIGSALVGAAVAAPATASPSPASEITATYHKGPQELTLIVYSASMGRSIPITVLTPREQRRPSPVLYLLNGAGGGEDSATWDARTNYRSYFANQNVYVVTPIGGAFSYYTDWQRDDPVLGRNKWQTFLTRELPPLIDAKFPTTRVNAIAGISMAGTSVLNLAIAAPHLYRSVAAFSGCARSSDPLGQRYIQLVVGERGGGDVVNMWGPLDGPGWRTNDPYLHAARLRGTKVYMTSGNGLPGTHEQLDDRNVEGDPLTLANQAVVGGGIEAAVDVCTRQMVTRMRELGVAVQVNFRPSGTHSWGYWQDDLHNTWPRVARDLR